MSHFRFIYVLEVNLEYSQHVHDVRIYRFVQDEKLAREEKLLATLYDKKRYVIHYYNLQQCTRHGLRFIKIHRTAIRAISMASRVHRTQYNFRTLAKNKFKTNLFKLMNVIFGKTMENMRNHINVLGWEIRCRVSSRDNDRETKFSQ